MKLETMNLRDLLPAAYNPRRISDAALSGLQKSLERFGLVQPIIWNQRTSTIVGGHQRVKALIQMGRTEAQVVVVDLPESEEKALNVALNSPAISGEFTDDLQDLLLEIESSDAELFEDLRLGELRIDIVLEPAPLLTDPDEIPKPPPEPVTRRGDIWICGKHRVMCGDSTVFTDVEKLLGSAKPKLMVTDPPYGVEYDPEWRNEAERSNGKKVGARATGLILNDDRADWREAWALFDGDVCYVYHAGLFSSVIEESLKACDLVPRSQIIWAKSNMVISRGDYHWQHEPCWYAVRKGAKGNRNSDRSQTTLWEIPKPSKSETGHGSQKPVECMARPMRNHTFSDVYDPFLGSGTSLIAAEQEGLVCYGMELNPSYCDVIVKRWQNATGKVAVLESSGIPFGDH